MSARPFYRFIQPKGHVTLLCLSHDLELHLFRSLDVKLTTLSNVRTIVLCWKFVWCPSHLGSGHSLWCRSPFAIGARNGWQYFLVPLQEMDYDLFVSLWPKALHVFFTTPPSTNTWWRRACSNLTSDPGPSEWLSDSLTTTSSHPANLCLRRPNRSPRKRFGWKHLHILVNTNRKWWIIN